MKTRCFPFAAILLPLVLLGGNLFSQTLNLPPRPADAPTGTQWAAIAGPMSQTDRENWVLAQVLLGNIPGWMRNLVPVTVNRTISGTPHTLTYYVTADYVAIGSDTDYFLEPMSPLLAQRLATLLNCTLPTRLMVNHIWTNSTVRMTAVTFDPNVYSINTFPVFVLENTGVRNQRYAGTNSHPLGALVSGDKKDIVVSYLIYTNFSGPTKPVVIYGWIQPNGSPIQGEVNVHEETYMDYSHGTRLVQMAVTLDGSPNTVTNILLNSTLWPLLSDESTMMTKPYYTVDNTIAPVIITPPRSQTVSPGSAVPFSVYAVGDTPITYAWKSNGVPLSGMTNASFTLTNVQPANAATYTVTLNNIYGSASSIPAVLKVNTNAFPLLFSDNFDTNSAASWNLFFGSGDGVQDYTADWAYDYGADPFTFNGQTFLIPPAPNSVNGVAKGVRFTVNNNDTNGVIAGLNIYPKNKFFSGNFALKFDLWLNYPGNAGGAGSTGSTEFAIFGLNHLDTEVNWAATSAPSTDGVWFGTDGEGGTSTDYRAYLGNPSGVQTLLAAGSLSGMASTDNGSGIYPALFPTNRFETIGAPGKNWVAGEVSQTNGLLTWKLDGTIIAQRANTSPFTNGDVMIGFMDPFASIASPTNNAFVIFDNVRVEDWSSAPLLTSAIVSQPTNLVVYTGGNAAFSVTPGGSSPFTYQWSCNGTKLAGATNSSFSLTNVQPAKAGVYFVVVSNAVGSITSTGAQLTVIPPIQFGALTVLNNGNFQFIFSGTLGIQYHLETSTNLTTWTPLATLPDNSNPVTFTDTNASSLIQRFYRVLP